LALREHEIPKPGPGEVLVRVRATSLNACELMILRGDYPLPVKPDVVAVFRYEPRYRSEPAKASD
jgi:NADPH:quinone reductase-like Zn-dependent oxidoreductase